MDPDQAASDHEDFFCAAHCFALTIFSTAEYSSDDPNALTKFHACPCQARDLASNHLSSTSTDLN